MDLHEGTLLGLSTGTVCLAYCGPVLIPLLLGENKSIASNFIYVSLFLSGRLLAYLIIGLLAGIAGTLLLQSPVFSELLVGSAYIILSLLLIFYGFYRFKEVCLGHNQTKIALRYFRKMPFMIPVMGGVLTGLNICPPLLLAITGATSIHNIAGSVLFFGMFFIGTSIYFIPLPFIGILKKQNALRIIGKFAAILSGLVYLYKGLFMIFN
jgi:sulfite exporter TauE/SafE